MTRSRRSPRARATDGAGMTRAAARRRDGGRACRSGAADHPALNSPAMTQEETSALSADLIGGCLCGAVRYVVSAGGIPESGYCHCRTCQRQSGAPVVAWFAVPPARVCYIKGAPARFRASDRATREFCADCGTYLVFREDDTSATVSVNTATLDDPSQVPPMFHIYTESRVSWFETADDLPRHPKGRG